MRDLNQAAFFFVALTEFNTPLFCCTLLQNCLLGISLLCDIESTIFRSYNKNLLRFVERS